MTDYAILLLSRVPRKDARVVTARALAEQTQVPWPTVVKLLKLLTAGGILSSTQGRQGGYKLARRPGEISLNDVIEAVEGRVGLTECTRQEGYCGIRDSCTVRPHWPAINRTLRETLAGITLETLADLDPGPRGVAGQRIPQDRSIGGGS